MRRLYVLPKEVHDSHAEVYSTHLTTHWLALCPTGLKDDVDAWRAAGSPVVVSTEFLGEFNQDRYECHPLVTVMPHPIWYGKEPITVARELPENASNELWGQSITLQRGVVARNRTATPSIGQSDGIDHLVDAGLGVGHSHTIVQAHRVLSGTHPGFRLSSIK